VALTPGLADSCALFEKLKHDGALLNEKVDAYRFFNFVVTGWSLRDWINSDTSLPSTVRAALDNLHQRDLWLGLCRDFANASKHFTLTYTSKIVSATPTDEGPGTVYGSGVYGAGVYGRGAADIDIRLNDGRQLYCPDLVKGVIATWEAFFVRHRLCP
jgi:hypothetical protein